MTELFNRAASVQMDTVLVTGLRIQFKIEKSEKQIPSSAEITVWNLKRDTRNKMAKLTVPLVLKAGYGNDIEQIFNGDVAPSGISVTRNGPDWLTTFKVGDGLKSYQTDRIQIPILPDTDVKKVLMDMIGQIRSVDTKKVIADLKAGNIPIAGKFQQMLNGSVASGRTIEEVNRMAASLGMKATVVDGQLELSPATETSSSGVFPEDFIPDLTPSTGLIGSPEVTKDGFLKIRCLLRPKIKPNRQFKITWSAHPDPLLCRTKRVTHIGDTRGQEWYTDIEGTALL